MKTKQEQINEIVHDLNLIKSLQASEIYTPTYQEAMMLVSLGYQKINNDCIVVTKDELKQYKVQAVKEFAERLKGKLHDFGDGGEKGAYITEKDIDETLKEYEE